MENRTLVIADTLFGECGEAAERFSELLLCKEPTRPLQFVLNAPLPYTIDSLLEKIAFDIIGKQAKRIILGLGLKELSHGISADKVFFSLKSLIQEIIRTTTSDIYIVTLPQEALPKVPSLTEQFNTLLTTLACERVKILDFSTYAKNFKNLQHARGKFARSLYESSGKATSMGLTLLSLFLLENLA